MQTELLIYVANKAVPHRHEVSPETTFEAVIIKLRADGVIAEDMVIVEQDSEEEIVLIEQVGSGGRHKRILHAHHCGHIHVDIDVPAGEPLKHKFRPAARVGLVKNWAVSHVANIDQNAKWCLRDAAGEILDNQVHIGTLASHPGCGLKVSLTEQHKAKG